jgi:protein involved in polysaccharide export with SLBB domain
MIISSVSGQSSLFKSPRPAALKPPVICRTLSIAAVIIAPWTLSAQLPTAAPAPAESPPPARLAVPAAPPGSSAPAPAAISAPTGYILSPNDQVAIEVFGEEDLRTNGRLNGEGNLSVPLLGSIHLGGLTLGQAVARLTELYGRDYLVSPRVNIMLIGYAKRRFTILGQVNRPGSYEMPEGSPEGIDLLEAIAMGGGYTRIAAPEKVSVRRGNQVLRVDAKRQARGSHAAFTIQPGDTITVGESIF